MRTNPMEIPAAMAEMLTLSCGCQWCCSANVRLLAPRVVTAAVVIPV